MALGFTVILVWIFMFSILGVVIAAKLAGAGCHPILAVAGGIAVYLVGIILERRILRGWIVDYVIRFFPELQKPE